MFPGGVPETTLGLYELLKGFTVFHNSDRVNHGRKIKVITYSTVSLVHHSVFLHLKVAKRKSISVLVTPDKRNHVR